MQANRAPCCPQVHARGTGSGMDRGVHRAQDSGEALPGTPNTWASQPLSIECSLTGLARAVCTAVGPSIHCSAVDVMGVPTQGRSQPVQVPGGPLPAALVSGPSGSSVDRRALLHGQESGGPLAAQRASGNPDLKEPLLRAHWAGNPLVRGFQRTGLAPDPHSSCGAQGGPCLLPGSAEQHEPIRQGDPPYPVGLLLVVSYIQMGSLLGLLSQNPVPPPPKVTPPADLGLGPR